METEKENIISAVQYYLKKKDTNYAILISGAWGSGKTYFLKNKIINNEGIQSAFHPVYISLDGINSIDVLKERIFRDINPHFRDSYALSKIRNQAIILNNTLNRCTTNTDLPNPIQSNILLCFDDLERIDLLFFKEALGYINTYIETYCIKTIFLCDETQCQIEDFRLIKEKYIRYTYKIVPSFNAFIETYLEKEGNTALRENINKKLLIEIFSRGNIVNLRTLDFVLEQFGSIFRGIETEYNKLEYYSNISRALLIITTIAAIEIKQYGTDIQTLKQLCAGLRQVQSFDGDNSKILEERVNNYLTEEQRQEYVYFEDVIDFLFDGNLKKAISAVKTKLTRQETSIGQQIINGLQSSDLDNDKYTQTIEKIRDAISAGSLVLVDYLYIYSNLTIIESNNIVGTEINNDLTDTFKKGIKNCIEKLNEYEIKQFNPGFFYHRSYSNTPVKYRNLIDYTDKLIEIKKEENHSASKSQVIESINNNDPAGYNNIVDNLKNENITFTQEDAGVIMNKLKEANGKILEAFANGIKDRYTFTDYPTIPPIIGIESNFIRQLSELVSNYINPKTRNNDFSILEMRRIDRILKDVMKHVRN